MAVHSAKAAITGVGLARPPFVGRRRVLQLGRAQPAPDGDCISCAPAALLVKRSSSRRGERCGRVYMAKNIFDEMLDVMEGGPKLRKWYGQDSSVNQPKFEFDDEDEEVNGENLPRTAVLVTDADTPLGDAVVMQLILLKRTVVVMVSDEEAAAARYGPYVRTVNSDAPDLMHGVQAVICPGHLGDLASVARAQGAEHFILVSATGASRANSGLLDGLFGGDDAKRKNPAREAAARNAALPLTIVRPGKVRNMPGGVEGLIFGQGDTLDGEVSLEDIAEVCVRALASPPAAGTIEFEVVNSNGGSRDLDMLFALLE